MAEWCVSGSESEGEQNASLEVSIEMGGLKIPPSRLLELMQQIDSSRTVELDCLSKVHRKRHKKKPKKQKRSKRHSPAGLKSGEEVSETASEVRSTTSTTATDYRESRRANMMNFDPNYDPELDDHPPVALETRSMGLRAPPKRQPVKLASLDKIIQSNTKRKQQLLQTSSRDHTPSPPYAPMTPVSPDMPNGGTERNGGTMEVPSFRFDDDDDSDMEGTNNEADMKFSLLSQINRVEKLLDSDGFT